MVAVLPARFITALLGAWLGPIPGMGTVFNDTRLVGGVVAPSVDRDASTRAVNWLAGTRDESCPPEDFCVLSTLSLRFAISSACDRRMPYLVFRISKFHL